MKSSLVLALIAQCFLASLAFAQLDSMPSARDRKPQEKKVFDKFYERLRIGYFGIITTPTFDAIDKGEWDKAALSPEITGGTNRDSWPTNVWNQLSFGYNYGGTMSFVVNPRWATPLTHPSNMASDEDTSFIMLDDLLVGFQGVVYSSADKKFNLWIRPGIRIPTSQGSINGTNRGAGKIIHQPELAYFPTYDINKTWQVGVFGMARQWVYEDIYDLTRFRFYNAAYVQYALNDTSRIALYFEHILETDQRSVPAADRKVVFKDLWQSVFLAFNHDVNKKLNIMPTLNCFYDRPITSNSFYAGMWISYTIK